MRYYISISIMLLLLVSVSAQTIKYTVDLGIKSVEIMPVMGDVDNDGTQELVAVAGSKLAVINGKTGKVEWTKNDAYWKSAELADTNRDGVADILYSTSGATIKSLRGNGSTLFSKRTTGDGQPLFPILTTSDSIYFATEDSSPSPFSGKISDYRGTITRLDFKGNIKATARVFHPCWGGMAYYDGILYVSDRNNGYEKMPARGLSALNATTLKEIWAHPEYMHSSNMPIIADYNGDGTMEVIATPLNKGAVVLNAKTGKVIKDYSGRSTNSHGTATVYDIDGDKHAEIIQASGFPDSAGQYFTVTDLVTGKVEFKPKLEYQVTWPPKVGDINNDGKMEILAGLGSQGKTESYPIIIYNSSYKEIKRIDPGRVGQIMPIRMYDVDSDGLFEMVVPTASGKILVYETPTKATKIDTYKQMYGNGRAGVPQ